MSSSLDEVREENGRLRQTLEIKENDLFVAATAGKQLLTRNAELEELIETTHSDYGLEIDKLKQSNHELKHKLELSNKLLSQCGDGGESESQRRRFENEQRALVERLETSWRKKTEQLREERTLVEESLDKERVNCEQLERRFKQQEETVRELGSEVERLSGLRQLEDEVGLLNGKLQAARQIRQNLDVDVQTLTEEKTAVQLERDNLLKRLEAALADRAEYEERLQETRKDLTSARSDATELQGQLEMMKAEQLNSYRQHTGNSLFGEVEDKRLELEKKLISQEVKYGSLQKVHTVTKQQLHKLKAQIGALLSVGRNQVDLTRVRQLELTLCQKQSEIRNLQAKLTSQQKDDSKGQVLSQLKDYHKAFSDFRDKRGYVDLLERELERSRSHTSDLQKELNERAILGLAKDDSLRLTESKLHQAESTIHELRQKQAKFTFQIHDMKTKQHIEMKRLKEEVELLRAAQVRSDQQKGDATMSQTNLLGNDVDTLLTDGVHPFKVPSLHNEATLPTSYCNKSMTLPSPSDRRSQLEATELRLHGVGPVDSDNQVLRRGSPTCLLGVKSMDAENQSDASARTRSIVDSRCDPTSKQNAVAVESLRGPATERLARDLHDSKARDTLNSGRKVRVSTVKQNPKIIDARHATVASECKQQ